MTFSQGHALVIGVGTHQYIPQADVPISVTDARSVAEVLQDPTACGYPPAQVQLIHDESATKAGILAALDDLAQTADADSTVFFFYCGHGAAGSDGNYYLVSHDAKAERGRVAAGTGVSEAELLQRIGAFKAQRMLVIFNACYSGHLSPSLEIGEDPLENRSLPDDTSTALLATGSGRIILTACRETQKSYIGTGTLSIFTQALIDGLRGKKVGNHAGYISLFDLYEHIFDQVSRTASALVNQPQEPELTVLKGVGPFAVSLFNGASTLGQFDEHQAPSQLPTLRQVEPEQAQKMLNQRQRQFASVNFVQGDKSRFSGNLFGGNQTVGGDFTGRDRITQGSKVYGDQTSVGDISGSTGVAIGRNAQVRISQGDRRSEIAALFSLVLQAAQAAPEGKREQALHTAQELQKEAGKGEKADDSRMATLIDQLIALVPEAAGAIVRAFANPLLAGLAGPITRWILEKFPGI